MLGSDPGQLVAQEADVFDVWGHRWLTGAARLRPARVSVRLTIFAFRGGVFQRSKQWYPLQQQQTGRRPRSHQVCVNNRYLHTHHLALSLPCCVSMVCLWTTAGSGLLEPPQTCASPPHFVPLQSSRWGRLQLFRHACLESLSTPHFEHKSGEFRLAWPSCSSVYRLRLFLFWNWQAKGLCSHVNFQKITCWNNFAWKPHGALMYDLGFSMFRHEIGGKYNKVLMVRRWAGLGWQGLQTGCTVLHSSITTPTPTTPRIGLEKLIIVKL